MFAAVGGVGGVERCQYTVIRAAMIGPNKVAKTIPGLMILRFLGIELRMRSGKDKALTISGFLGVGWLLVDI
jgi:hypothetical protein